MRGAHTAPLTHAAIKVLRQLTAAYPQATEAVDQPLVRGVTTRAMTRHPLPVRSN